MARLALSASAPRRARRPRPRKPRARSALILDDVERVGAFRQLRLDPVVLAAVDGIELDAVADAKQRDAAAEGRDAPFRVQHGERRAADHVEAAGRVQGLDRALATGADHRALGRPHAGRVVLGRVDDAARVERAHEREPRIGADDADPVLGRRMEGDQLIEAGEAVLRHNELGVVGALLDGAVVLLHAGAGPGVEIEGGHVDQPALDLVGRPHRVGQQQRLAHEVVVGDPLPVVLDEHGVEAGVGLNHAGNAGLVHGLGEAAGLQVESEPAVVAELEQDEAVAVGRDQGLLVLHAAHHSGRFAVGAGRGDMRTWVFNRGPSPQIEGHRDRPCRRKKDNPTKNDD